MKWKILFSCCLLLILAGCHTAITNQPYNKFFVEYRFVAEVDGAAKVEVEDSYGNREVLLEETITAGQHTVQLWEVNDEPVLEGFYYFTYYFDGAKVEKVKVLAVNL